MNRTFKLMLSAAILLTGIAVLPACNGARDTALNEVAEGPKGFMIKTMTRGTRTRKYGLFIPSVPPTAAAGYPVIIFLHGMGEGGSDAHANLRVGLAPFVADRASDFPFICIFPQSDSGSWDENSENAMDVITTLDEVSKAYKVDQDRVSLTGLSTGGYGTWAIGAKFKDRFAALVPMGSSADAGKYASQLLDMPVRSYHNGGDIFAGIWNDSSMVEKIKTMGGSKAEFTQTNGPGHDCWEGVYADGELFIWLQMQRRSARTSGTSSAAGKASSSAASPSHASAAASQATVRSNAGAVVNTPY